MAAKTLQKIPKLEGKEALKFNEKLKIPKKLIITERQVEIYKSVKKKSVYKKK